MANELPDYVATARPVSQRAPWFRNVAPTYAGIMLWFVFWQAIVSGGNAGFPGGVLAAGLMPALFGVVIAALVCHFLFYLVPGLLGMQTGLPLYVVGTSTYGVTGGLIMPGFVMGLLQFGWLAVNAWAVATLLCACFGLNAEAPSLSHGAIAAVWAALAAFAGLKGIRYVAPVATYLPLIPLVVLVMLAVNSFSGVEKFKPELVTASPEGKAPAHTDTDAAAKLASDAPGGDKVAQPAAADAPETKAPLDAIGVMLLLATYVVGFFATAGAAGTDIASNARGPADVQLGGLVGIVLATIVAGGLALVIVAGAYGNGLVPTKAGSLDPIDFLGLILGEGKRNTIMILLAVSSFPPACFSALIAANSFKTTMPRVNPFVSVGIGTLVAIVLAVTGVVGKVIWVFTLIGASFGPVCGAMMADYLLAGRRWAGPRAGFNPAGWISWVAGFIVGASPFIPGLVGRIPCPPVAAFVVGFVLYLVLAMVGLQSRQLPKPADVR